MSHMIRDGILPDPAIHTGTRRSLRSDGSEQGVCRPRLLSGDEPCPRNPGCLRYRLPAASDARRSWLWLVGVGDQCRFYSPKPRSADQLSSLPDPRPCTGPTFRVRSLHGSRQGRGVSGVEAAAGDLCSPGQGLWHDFGFILRESVHATHSVCIAERAESCAFDPRSGVGRVD